MNRATLPQHSNLAEDYYLLAILGWQALNCGTCLFRKRGSRMNSFFAGATIFALLIAASSAQAKTCQLWAGANGGPTFTGFTGAMEGGPGTLAGLASGVTGMICKVTCGEERPLSCGGVFERKDEPDRPEMLLKTASRHDMKVAWRWTTAPTALAAQSPGGQTQLASRSEKRTK